MPALAPRSDWAEVTRAVLVDEFVVRLCIEQDIEEMRLWGHGIECPGIIPKPMQAKVCSAMELLFSFNLLSSFLRTSGEHGQVELCPCAWNLSTQIYLMSLSISDFRTACTAQHTRSQMMQPNAGRTAAASSNVQTARALFFR